MDNTPLRKPPRPLNWLAWVCAIALVGTGLFFLGNQSQERRTKERAELREQMANSKIVYVADPVQKLVRRTDGSYYTKTAKEESSDIVNYDYTTIEGNDVVVPKSVSSEEQEQSTLFLWFIRTKRFTNDVTVRVIDPHAADQRPRVERLRCTVAPIDASKPSYTGDPHAKSLTKIGSNEIPRPAGLFSDAGEQLCQDRIVFLVPDGSIQP